MPLSSPLAWALLAVARRPLGASAVTSPITVEPGLTVFDGIIQGNLNAVSAADHPLVFKFVGASKGGKLDLRNVPIALDDFLPDDALGGPQSFTLLPYADWLDPENPQQYVQPTGTETFKVRATEVTPFDEFLTNVPLIGALANPIIGLLQKTPLIGQLLAPIIGATVVTSIDVDLDTEVADGQRVAFTYKVPSFDGTLISANFFPATTLDAQTQTPSLPQGYGFTLFNGPGLGGAGGTDPYATNQTLGTVPGLFVLRGQAALFAGQPTPGTGFSVVTWDPRGEFASGGILQLDNPNFEGLDVSALITWATENTPAITDDGDPLVGMIGGSYGGGIQMNVTDPRVDAIVPTIAWNSLNESLYPSSVFKTGWANILGLFLLEARARVNQQIWRGILTGDVFGWLSQTSQAVLGSSNTTPSMQAKNIPTLFVQGTVDALFPLAQAVRNAQILAENLNPFSSMIWICGGHGVCLDPVDPAEQYPAVYQADMTWLNFYLKLGIPIPAPGVPTFQWWDQLGDNYTSDFMPFDPDFYGSDLPEVNDAGGRLTILPFAIGGSGPYRGPSCDAEGSPCAFPLNQVIATKSRSAVSVNFNDTNGLVAGVQVVGAPTVAFDYSGLGTSRAVYAQVVDNDTGRVLGNIATPIPLKLNGKQQTVTFSIADIAYTAPEGGGSLTVQIVPTSNLYWNSSWGTVNISNVRVTLPTVALLG